MEDDRTDALDAMSAIIKSSLSDAVPAAVDIAVMIVKPLALQQRAPSPQLKDALVSALSGAMTTFIRQVVTDTLAASPREEDEGSET